MIENEALICKKCKTEVNGHFCSECGTNIHPQRVDGTYVYGEITQVLNLDKGILLTLKELLINPGLAINEFLTTDRNRLVKPILFLLFCSLFYQVFCIDEKELIYSSKTYLYTWTKQNYGYSSVLLGIFISLFVKLFFYKYDYNIYEIIILICYITGIGSLITSFLAIISIEGKEHYFNFASAIITLIYYSWGISQFFDNRKVLNYFLSLFAYMAGKVTYVIIVIMLDKLLYNFILK